MKILVTGTAGFIGFHVAQRLLERGDGVVGLDNLNAYYDVNLKKARLKQLENQANFEFVKMELVDQKNIATLFEKQQFDVVIHLAAQAGVRYSLENPHVYIDSNVNGFCNILEGCRHTQIKHLVFASTSSVYGLNAKQPFSEHHNTEHPITLYAATKKANEVMAHSYAHLFNIPCSGLRFFTVYGPWGRPDMALFKFTQNILNNKPIEIYNHGDMTRDFTYIDDIVEGIIRVADNSATPCSNWDANSPDPATSSAPYRIYNIGNNQPVKLSDFVGALENALGKEAEKIYLPIQPGDVESTWANIDELVAHVDFQPKTTVQYGIDQFVAWYKSYYL